jgi:putative endonuclease
MYYIYALKCVPRNGQWKFYIGYTANLKARLQKHRSKATQTTRRFKSIELVYYEACVSEKDARQRERQLKTGFGRGYLNRRLENYLRDKGA